MPVNITCPNCQKALQLPETLMGKKVRCPGCKEVFTAAQPEEQIQAADEFEEIQERPSRPAAARPRRPAPPPEEEEEAEMDDEDAPRRGKPHRGGMVLTMGILSLVFAFCCLPICWILGAVTLVMASTDLKQMALAKMDRSGQGQTKTGKMLALIGIILCPILYIIGFILNMALKH